MIRAILIIPLLLCATGVSAQTVFRAKLKAVESNGKTLAFGADTYRIDSRDARMCLAWRVDDPCKITEEGPRPETYARIYNERLREWVRGDRVSNEDDKKREIEKERRLKELAGQREGQERVWSSQKRTKPWPGTSEATPGRVRTFTTTNFQKEVKDASRTMPILVMFYADW